MTVKELKEILNQYDENLMVCSNILGSYFPIRGVELGEHWIYPVGCEGVPSHKEKCVKIL